MGHTFIDYLVPVATKGRRDECKLKFQNSQDAKQNTRIVSVHTKSASPFCPARDDGPISFSRILLAVTFLGIIL